MKTVKNFLFLLAVALPLIGFVACSDSDDKNDPTENKPSHNGDGPIEEPILAFYETPQYIKAKENRKLLQDDTNNSNAIQNLIYQGATSAEIIVYSFHQNKLYAATTHYDKKNKQRIIDFIKSKYTVDEYEYDILSFQTRDMLIMGEAGFTNGGIVIAYTRQFTQEQEKATYVEPIVKWGEGVDYVKANEARKNVEESEFRLQFTDDRYAGIAIYNFLPIIGLEIARVFDIPAFHLNKIIEDFESKYVSVTPENNFFKSFVSEERNLRIDVYLETKTSFSLFYTPITIGDNDNE